MKKISFTPNEFILDAYVFLEPEEIKEEVKKVIQLNRKHDNGILASDQLDEIKMIKGDFALRCIDHLLNIFYIEKKGETLECFIFES